jgi:DNA-nicking Smr family endonuclease
VPIQIAIANIEDGRPTRPQALSRLTTELNRARRDGAGMLKIIHGYGSSGEGGAIRLAIQAQLVQMEREGEIRAFIPGEEWRISNEATWALLRKYPELKRDRDLGRGNKGISVIVF